MIKNFALKKYILELIKIKFFFKIPNQKKIILLDKFGYHEKYKILPKSETYIIDTQNLRINLFILLKSFIQLKFSKLNYIETYINHIRPKILITFLDNNEIFYEISNKFVTKIVVQNGRRLSKKKNFSPRKKTSDYIFTLSEIDKKFYKNIGVDCKNYITHGSYRCNSQPILKEKIKVITDIIYVSTYRKFYKNKKISVYKNITSSEYIKNELKLIEYISEFCKKNNKTLSILMRHPKYTDLSLEEKKFFYKQFKMEKINYIYSQHYEENNFFDKSKNLNSSYNNLFKAKIVVGIDSTLLYEAFSLGCRVGFFGIRGSKAELKYRSFGWPHTFSEKGNFWCNNLNKEEIFNILNNLFKFKKTQWSYNLKKYEFIMSKDDGNKKLKKILKKILIK